jgi:hypothetical protein
MPNKSWKKTSFRFQKEPEPNQGSLKTVLVKADALESGYNTKVAVLEWSSVNASDYHIFNMNDAMIEKCI